MTTSNITLLEDRKQQFVEDLDDKGDEKVKFRRLSGVVSSACNALHRTGIWTNATEGRGQIPGNMISLTKEGIVLDYKALLKIFF